MTFGEMFGAQWQGWELVVVQTPEHVRPWKVEYTGVDDSGRLLGRIHVASYLTRSPAEKLVELLHMLDDLDHTMYAAELQRKALNDFTDPSSST